jgi:hypothetical protein
LEKLEKIAKIKKQKKEEIKMRRKRQDVARRLVTTFMVVGVMVAFSFGALAQEEGRLFMDSEVKSIDVSGDIDVSLIFRTRLVRPVLDLLQKEHNKQLILNLFDDVEFKAILNRTDYVTPEKLSWIGHLEGIEYSEVILVKGEGILTGSINFPGGIFEIVYVKEGIHRINEINPSSIPPPSEPIQVYIDPTEESMGNDPSILTDDGSFIDVMVVYTADARTAAGGTDGIKNLINQGISQTNQGYLNSGVNQRIKLAHSEEVGYSEAGFDWNVTLDRLRIKNDGYMDGVHNLRDTYKADTVVLLVEYSKKYWGLAYKMTTLSNIFEAYAFAVVTRKGVTQSYAFPHELGHNMGCAHDRANANEPGAYPYSYGYQAPDYSFRTIMAYDCPNGCTQVNYWSNPDKIYNGLPMGVAEGNPNSADNRKTLNKTAFTVANFRISENQPPVFNTTYGTVNGREGTAISLDLSATDPDMDTLTYSAAGTPSGASFNTITGAFNWTPTYTQDGIYVVTFTASDGQAMVNQNVTINITNVKKIKK